MKQIPQLKYFGGEFATQALVPGKVYGERIAKQSGDEYRIWDFHRSKLAAAIKHGLKNFPFHGDSEVLYLGAGNGTTVSHISDICKNGLIYCIEFSPRAMTDLYQLCMKRENLAPILGNAMTPIDYEDRVKQVDIIYQDVAQRTQVDILEKNADLFLKQNGWIFMMVKARSIDVTMEPKKVFEVVKDQLLPKFDILETIRLDPYEKDHMCIVGRMK